MQVLETCLEKHSNLITQKLTNYTILV